MFSRNDKYYEWLPAYLEDGLDPAQKALMVARLAADPALALEALRLRPLLEALRESKSHEAAAPAPASSVVPGDLWLRLQDRLDPAPVRHPARQYGWLAGVGATAALAVIVALRLPQSMPTETHAISPPVHVVPQAIPRPLTQPTEGVLKIAKTNPPPAVKALNVTINGSGLPPHPAQIVSPTPPPTTITNGVNDRFTAPSAPASTSSTYRQRRPLTIPAPISAAGTAPALPQDNKARVAIANKASKVHITGEVNVIGPPPTAPIAPTPAPAPMSALNNVMQSASQAQVSPPAAKPHLEERARQGDAAAMRPGVPYAKARVFNRTRMLPMSQGVVPAVSLETEQAALSAALQAPLWGEDSGAAQANQALMAIREAGQLDTLRSRLEARREQSPLDISTGRMLAAVYEFGFQSDLSLRERRRIVEIAGAGGEDWFALALAEERAGNMAAAKADYHHAAESPAPLNSFHAAQARQRG